MRLSAVLVVLLAAVVLPGHGLSPFFRARGRAIVDGFGRERIFHGVNIVVKVLSSTHSYDCETHTR